jgi:1,4-dihydroxy-2-naphthoate octaprenyltransferase
MSRFALTLGPMRVPFLILTPACVVLGLGTALWIKGSVDWFYFALAMIGAVASHISVNAYNEYLDFKSGLDFKTERTPFSGGSGTLPQHPEMVRTAFWTATISMLIAGAVGLFFVYVWGWTLLPLGIIGLILLFAYTKWLVYNPWLCLIAPGLGFGTLMVTGTHFVLTGEYSWTAFLASFIQFFLVSNLLFLNQFPDVEADRSIGKKHFPLLIGGKKSSFIYGFFLLMTYVVIVSGVALHLFPVTALLGLITLALAVPAFIGAYKYYDNIPKLIPFMGFNVIINIITPVLVAIGLMM